MTRMQALMVGNGLPASLLLTTEQRRALWEACPPRPMPLFQDRTRVSEDADTAAFRAQIEEERRQKSRAQIDRMKNRFASKAVDHTKMRWDQRRNKFVEDHYAVAKLIQHADSHGSTNGGTGSRPSAKPSRPTCPELPAPADGSPDWYNVTKDNARALAELNDVWDDKYAKLSGGLLVMTVSNKLKGLAKKGYAIVWLD